MWNPSYGADVVESHVRILRRFAEGYRSRQIDEDDVYVWWGKIRSAHRQAPLPHLNQILALENELKGEENVVTRELQLYLTDYRSLYVAHVGGITGEDVRASTASVRKPGRTWIRGRERSLRPRRSCTGITGLTSPSISRRC